MLYMFLAVVRMNRFGPAPALRLFRGHTGVIEPHLIDRVTVAIRASRPCCCGDRINDGSKIQIALRRRFPNHDVSALPIDSAEIIRLESATASLPLRPPRA